MNRQRNLAADARGRQIAQALDESAARLSPDAQSRLAAARALALSRKKAQPAPNSRRIPVFSPASAFSLAPSSGGQSRRGARWGSAGFALACACAFFLVLPPSGRPVWSHPDEQAAALDAALLTSEAPPRAWADPGFEAYLEQQGNSSAVDEPPAGEAPADEG